MKKFQTELRKAFSRKEAGKHSDPCAVLFSLESRAPSLPRDFLLVQAKGTNVYVLRLTHQSIKTSEANCINLDAACVHHGEIDALMSNILVAGVMAVRTVSVTMGSNSKD